MTEDIHEPVELYQRVFREEHARNTSEYFEELVRRSGVDEEANIRTLRELRTLERRIGETDKILKRWRILRAVVVVLGALCLAAFALQHDRYLWLIGPAAAAALVFFKLNPILNDVDGRLKRLREERDRKLEEAWLQMEPLNRLYDWDSMAQLVGRTVPRIELDPYFSNARLDELRDSFGWDDRFNDGCSVVFSHSGVLNGNPFILARTLDHWMGSKTYHGSLDITWTEQVRDSNGRWNTVRRHQTLHASVERPCPEYGHRSFIAYGNEAAPDLSFSRTPSSLSALDDGMIGNWKKRKAVKKLEARSRDLEKGEGFTVMANREFDALFGATDRDHEVQFRLLFTPLAQQEMLKLLKDRKVGYGDDFDFSKHRMINIVEPRHMAETDISASPESFRAYELSEARKQFNEYHNDLFRSFFFGISPLLAIPLYQQHRSHADIYRDVYGRQACFWEHESIANYYGEKQFQHPDCITRSILKTRENGEREGVRTVSVTAHGYSGTERVAYVPVYGKDGRHHDVPVPWVEYHEVENETDMAVRETRPSPAGEAEAPGEGTPSWHEELRARGVEPGRALLRRSIVSAVIPR